MKPLNDLGVVKGFGTEKCVRPKHAVTSEANDVVVSVHDFGPADAEISMKGNRAGDASLLRIRIGRQDYQKQSHGENFAEKFHKWAFEEHKRKMLVWTEKL